MLGTAADGDWFHIARGGKALGYVYAPLNRSEGCPRPRLGVEPWPVGRAQETGRTAEADKMEARAKAIRDKRTGE